MNMSGGGSRWPSRRRWSRSNNHGTNNTAIEER